MKTRRLLSALPNSITLIHASLSRGTYFVEYEHTRAFNGPLSGTTQVSRHQKGKTNLDITESRDSEWQWHQLGHMQVCTSLQIGNHASIPPLRFLQAGCPSCHPTNSIKALKAKHVKMIVIKANVYVYASAYNDSCDSCIIKAESLNGDHGVRNAKK